MHTAVSLAPGPREPAGARGIHLMDQRAVKSSHGPDERLSSSLLELAQNGDEAALETLVARYRPRLVRWANGRLPRWARDIADTQDLVQDALFHTFKRMASFEWRGDGSLHAYLRHAILNRIRQELRRVKRQPQRVDLDSQSENDDLSPLEHAIGREALDRYERALAELGAEDREVIVARVELGHTNAEIADLLQKPSANAARMALERALVRLAKKMAASST